VQIGTSPDLMRISYVAPSAFGSRLREAYRDRLLFTLYRLTAFAALECASVTPLHGAFHILDADLEYRAMFSSLGSTKNADSLRKFRLSEGLQYRPAYIAERHRGESTNLLRRGGSAPRATSYAPGIVLSPSRCCANRSGRQPSASRTLFQAFDEGETDASNSASRPGSTEDGFDIERVGHAGDAIWLRGDETCSLIAAFVGVDIQLVSYAGLWRLFSDPKNYVRSGAGERQDSPRRASSLCFRF
jgi:hypothetical protein